MNNMPKPLIIESISQQIKLDKKEETFLLSLLQIKKLKKKQFLIHSGEVNTFSTFVTSGCLRSYSIDRNGFEHILQFAPKGWWIADLHSLISKQPGQLNIDALCDTEVMVFKREDQEKLFESFPKFERFFRILTENSIAATNNRLLDYMGLSAQERYMQFIKRYPGLTNEIPQKLIASYIGITPEFLSKLKAESLRKK